MVFMTQQLENGDIISRKVTSEQALEYELCGLAGCALILPWNVTCSVAETLIRKYAPPYKHQEWRDKLGQKINELHGQSKGTTP